jgi:hypothetical protein
MQNTDVEVRKREKEYRIQRSEMVVYAWLRGTTLKFRDPVAKSRVLEACSQGVLVECGVMISQDENMNTTISQRRGVELVVLGNAANQLNCQKPCRGTQRRAG